MNLSVNKAHGHNDISITVLKICDSVLAKPLIIIFKSCNDWSFSSYLEIFPI